MAAYDTAPLCDEYHRAIVDWQKKNFPELKILEENWPKHFGSQTPFKLTAKIGKTRSGVIEVGDFVGRPKYEHAGEMIGNMFYSARDIIRAQCSTELGSIQQHRLTLDAAISDEGKFAVLRIMAEELRHAYQMFWVLDHDETWNKQGHSDFARETIDELLAMETGSHVLDAFNIEFLTFLDNSMFATVIDLVGKYQLEMQRVFSYAPMAQSMQPMLSEEGFHMASGRNLVKEIALRALEGKGDFSFEDVQRALNQWFPRGVEMFGNETGGLTAVHFGFKDKANGEAQAAYVDEVKGIFEDVNVAVASKRLGLTDREEARKLVREVVVRGEEVPGLKSGDLLYVPHPYFFRRRGPDDYTWRPYDLRGEMLTDEGKPISADAYLRYLEKVLPSTYFKTRDSVRFKETYRQKEAAPAPSGGFLL